jgi:hypothetical protein
MGYLSNYKSNGVENVSRSQSAKEEIALAVQIDCLQLVSSAYNDLIADQSYLFQPDETAITAKLYGEIEKNIRKDDLNYCISPDPFEYTDDIIEGRVSPKKAKKYDLILENWNNKNKVKFGVEAKLLVETKYKNKRGTTLVREYVSDAGMGKYIKNIYQRKGIMVGYVLEGTISKIISRINTEVTAVYNHHHLLNLVDDDLYPLETYLSIHSSGGENLLLYHLMLDFNKKSSHN